MTVAELISILQQHDPAAVVALRWDWDPNDPAVALTCEELRPGVVQAVQLHKLNASTDWFDPLGGAQLYEQIDDERDHRAAVQGVLLG